MPMPDALIDLQQEVVSNFDGVVDETVRERLRSGDCWAAFSAWNFWARVWFGDGAFHAEVWRYGSPVETLSGGTVEDLREAVCNEYGWS